MHFICLTLLLRRSLSDIHDTEPCNNNKNLSQNLSLTRFQQHPSQPGIQGQARQLSSDLGKLPLPGFQRAHLLKSPETLTDSTRRRGVQKGKLPDIPQPQRLHPQHHPGKRGPPDFGIGKLGSLLKVKFVIQSQTYSLPDPSAPSPPLTCTRLRDLLNL